MQSHPPNFTTRFWWQDGQKWHRLDEKPSRYSWPHASQHTHTFRSLFGVKSLAKEFRKIFIGHLEQLYGNGELDLYGNTTPTGTPEGFAGLIATLKAKKWIVYAKTPFAGSEQVLDYLGRYTHWVAISNHRLVFIDDEKVTFTYKDRSDKNRSHQMTLSADEFIRRFRLHVLPPRFVKIRYFGFLSHRDKHRNIALIRALMAIKAVMTVSVVEDAPTDHAAFDRHRHPVLLALRQGTNDGHVQNPERQPYPRVAIALIGFLILGSTRRTGPPPRGCAQIQHLHGFCHFMHSSEAAFFKGCRPNCMHFKIIQSSSPQCFLAISLGWAI